MCWYTCVGGGGGVCVCGREGCVYVCVRVWGLCVCGGDVCERVYVCGVCVCVYVCGVWCVCVCVWR